MVKFISEIIYYLSEIFKFVKDKLFSFMNYFYDWFMYLIIWEKLILITGIPALLAVVLPVAKFDIFESYFSINNPLAIYMIGVAGIMFLTIFYRGKIGTIVRIIINAYYIAWAIYIPLGPGLTKAENYEISINYFLNFLVPALYIIFSLLSYKEWKN